MKRIIITEAQHKALRERQLNEKLELKSFDEYAKIVKQAYDELPNYDAGAVPHWQALNQSNYDWWKRLTGEAEIQFVSGDAKYKEQEGAFTIAGKSYPIKYWEGGQPYDTATQMADSFKRDGVLYISMDYSNHPVFSVEDNVVFRTVHDYIVHIKGGFEFGLKGEFSSYNLHARLAPENAVPALFTEIIGQVSYAVVTGDFPTQKIGVMQGFDFKRVGYVEGYEVRDRELHKLDSPEQD